MFAIILDENNYIIDVSDKFRKPGSILVNEIPQEENPDKLQCYQYIEGEFVFDADKWAVIEAERAEMEAERAEIERINGIHAEIDSLKSQIESSDYQIIKCYEYALNNLELPYDAAQLHESRQALRDRINELEKELIPQEGEE